MRFMNRVASLVVWYAWQAVASRSALLRGGASRIGIVRP